jgi:hypothetical protein
MNVRLAMLAICELDNLLERCIQQASLNLSAPQLKAKVSEERNRLGIKFPFLGVARDVHDTHKHGQLHRPSAKVSQAQKPTTVCHGGSGLLGFGSIGEGSLGEGPSEYLVIVADDGRTHELGSVIAQCEEHLKAEVQRLGS